MDSSKLPVSKLSPAAQELGAPKARPSLLPAFEPTSSSPTLPRPQKRKLEAPELTTSTRYPTPMPTSSTVQHPSSSPPLLTRPALNRTVSNVSQLSQRKPLEDVPSIDLPANGEPILLGRSTNSSHYQLPSNRLISRVHIRVSYKPDAKEIVIVCLGWNGCRVHCKSQIWALGKDDTFVLNRSSVEPMLEVHGARVLIRWPSRPDTPSPSGYSDSSWAVGVSPSTSPSRVEMPSSPPIARYHSPPVSPSPRGRISTTTTFLGGLGAGDEPVKVYEDPSSDAPAPDSQHTEADASQTSSSLSPARDSDELSDHDEENDPLIHSFYAGPSLLPRLASMDTAGSPISDRPRATGRRGSKSPSQDVTKHEQKLFKDLGVELSPIRNHVINQLVYSRLHALPLSTIFKALPASMRNAPEAPPALGAASLDDTENKAPELPRGRSFNAHDLRTLLESTACVGGIQREGKDAAGKPLEDEYYYVPEMDSDEIRRGLRQSSLGGTGLRSVRKQHKQYYWKRPRF